MSRSLGQSAKEYGRGIVGGLLFGLPLLYTMEVWWSGFIASPERLLIGLAATFLLLFGYNHYAGMHREASFADNLSETVEELGLGLLVAALMLWLIGRIGPGMSLGEVAGKVAVETMAMAIGISVGTEQQAGHFVVPVQVRNDGDRTAQDVHVEVQLGAGPSGEKGTFTLDWLPRQAQQEGRVTFSHKPSHDSLSARVLGFKVP